MRRHVSLLLIVALLAVVVTLVAGDNKEVAGGADVKDKEKEEEDKREEEKEKTEEAQLYQSPAGQGNEKSDFIHDMGPCKDASDYCFEPADKLAKDPEFTRSTIQWAIEKYTMRTGKALELVKIVSILKRPGCGIYYYLNMKVKNQTSQQQVLNCEYFYSDYFATINHCEDEDTSSQNEGSDLNKCQDPKKNKYEELKNPDKAMYFATLAILEHNSYLDNDKYGKSVELAKITKAKRKPGCNVFYRFTLMLKDVDRGGEVALYDSELFDNGHMTLHYFRKQ